MKSWQKYSLAGFLSLFWIFSGCGKSEMTPFLTKLPDGRVRIEYEKFIESPFEEFVRSKNLDSRLKEEKEAVFWMPKQSAQGMEALITSGRDSMISSENFNGCFFQKTNYFGKKTIVGNVMNPSDGIPEAFIIPIIDRESGDKKNLHAYLFLDKDYMDKAGKIGLYYFSGTYREKAYIIPLPKLKFESEKGIFFSKLESKAKAVDAFSETPCFFVGDIKGGENSTIASIFESQALGNSLYTIYGIYNPFIRKFMNPLEDEKAIADRKKEEEAKRKIINDMLSRCLDKGFQERLARFIKEEEADRFSSIVHKREYQDCFYLGLRILTENDAMLLVFSKNERLAAETLLKINKKGEFSIKEYSDVSDTYDMMKSYYEKNKKE